jgi:hypothetical protein
MTKKIITLYIDPDVIDWYNDKTGTRSIQPIVSRKKAKIQGWRDPDRETIPFTIEIEEPCQVGMEEISKEEKQT